MTVYGIQFWIECKGGLKTADELSDALDDLVYDGNLSLGYSNHSIMGAGLFMKNAVQNNFESIREILNEFADKIKYVSEWDYEDSSDIKWGVHILGESKKSARKSIKESKSSSILDDEFYDLIEEGYIYDEDENGMNMSYGEYVAVSDDLWETLENELEYYRDFPSAYDAYNEIMDNTSDDAKMFMGISDDDYFYFEINEDENTYSFSGEVPTALEKLFKKFLKETDFERV